MHRNRIIFSTAILNSYFAFAAPGANSLLERTLTCAHLGLLIVPIDVIGNNFFGPCISQELDRHRLALLELPKSLSCHVERTNQPREALSELNQNKTARIYSNLIQFTAMNSSYLIQGYVNEGDQTYG